MDSNWLFVVTLLVSLIGPAALIARTRDIFAPEPIAVVVLTALLFGDFLSDRDALSYQIEAYPTLYGPLFTYLFVLYVILVAYSFAHARRSASPRVAPDPGLSRVVLAGISAVFIAEVLRRLMACSGDVALFLSSHLLARGHEPWSLSIREAALNPLSQGGGRGTATIGSLISQLFRLCSIGLPILLVWHPRKLWVGAMSLYYLGSTFLAGVREPFLLFFVTYALAFHFRYGLRARQIALAMPLAATLGLAMNVQHAARGYGFAEVMRNPRLAAVGPTLHVDNTLRALSGVFERADRGETAPSRLQAAEYATLNFVPRKWWSGKPRLDQEYWGTWKLAYVSVSFVGEFIIFLGRFAGLFAAVLWYGLVLEMLRAFSKRIRTIEDVVIYASSCGYAFYLLRSPVSLSQNSYVLLGAIAISVLAKYGRARSSRAAARPLSRQQAA